MNPKQNTPENQADRRRVTFASLGLHPNLLKGIHDLGFLRPTAIQAKAIPPILAGQDLIGCAQTGTGKTAAFVLPILHRLMKGQSRRNMRALIVLPTRELALQVMDHLKSMSRYVHLKGAAIFGGVPMNPQITALARGVDIVSATPGRLMDHIYSGRIDFVDLEVVVLDEADRMLDMGFLPVIQKILTLLPANRQSLLFSATMPPEIMKLAHKMLRQPVSLQIGERTSPAVGIRHAVYPVPRHLKNELLLRLLQGEEMASVLVFTRTKYAADRLANRLKGAGLNVSVLHGDRNQSQRLHALEEFRMGRHQVMVATDIAARGIDVEGITHVINFDLPNTPEDYVHRIGRTARAQATGDAFSLVDRDEEPLVTDIERALNISLPRVTLPHFNYREAAVPRSHRPFHRTFDSRHGLRPWTRSGFRPTGEGRGATGVARGAPQGKPVIRGDAERHRGGGPPKRRRSAWQRS